MRGCRGVRIATAAATKSIRSEHDNTADDNQHNRFAGHRHHSHQHAAMYRLVNMSAASAGP